MTLRLLVQCQGTRADRPTVALETCRAFLPVPVDYTPRTQLIDPDAAIRRAYEAGWTQTRTGRDLCPSCTAARAYLRAALAPPILPAPITGPTMTEPREDTPR